MAQANASASTLLTSADFPADLGPDGRRREPRTEVDRPIVIIPFNTRKGMRFQPARLIACSRHGLGVLLGKPLALGGQFLVKARLRESVLLLYTVRNCRRWRGGFRIGAEFAGIIGPPGDRDAADVLAALLDG